MTDMDRIVLSNVHYTYPNTDVEILHGISLNIKVGEYVSIVGQSGCGKSTIMKLIQGILKSDNVMVNCYKSRMSYVPQSGNLLPYLTVKQNLQLHSKIVNRHKLTSTELTTVMQRVSLNDNILDRYPRDLSGGQRQRASIANALIIDNLELLMFDEAFSALDEITRMDIQDTIMSISKNNKNLTILSITHDIDEAIIASDRIIHIDNGNVVSNGDPSQVLIKDKFIDKSDIPCKIHWDAWKISALRKMGKMHRNKIIIVDDNMNELGELSQDIIENEIKYGRNNNLKQLLEIVKQNEQNS